MRVQTEILIKDPDVLGVELEAVDPSRRPNPICEVERRITPATPAIDHNVTGASLDLHPIGSIDVFLEQEGIADSEPVGVKLDRPIVSGDLPKVQWMNVIRNGMRVLPH